MTTAYSKKRLYIDIETYSEETLSKSGVYRYAASPSFDVLLIGFAFDDDSIHVWDAQNKQLYRFKNGSAADDFGDVLRAPPPNFKDWLTAPEIMKIAHNASFEMTCLSRNLGIEIEPEQWTDTMALANIGGLPSSLADLSEVFGLGERGKKDYGKSLIKKFCAPPKLTSEDAPAQWLEFIKYNRFDVEAEREIYKRLMDFIEVTPTERKIYCTDYRINRRGIRADRELAEHAFEKSQALTKQALRAIQRTTQLTNPNSLPALQLWAKTEGFNFDDLTRTTTTEFTKQRVDPRIAKVLDYKNFVAKASLKKYEAVLRTICPDERIHGAFQYYGASRSGRWAGRLVQLQNLKRNNLPDIDVARELVRLDDTNALEIAYGVDGLQQSELLGQLVRTILIPSDGNKFIIADYSAIEARVISWLAGETWRQEIFSQDGDIYKASYSQAFGVPVENVTKDMRQKGKIMELALGYGGGVGALKAFGADKLGLNDTQLKELVTRWRNASPRIIQFWKDLERLARAAVSEGLRGETSKGIVFERKHLLNSPVLTVTLPSKRKLYYQNAALEVNPASKFENPYPQLSYNDISPLSHQYKRVFTFGGKIAENITQAVARDCLAEALIRLEERGFQTVAHIHDEVIIDAPQQASVKEVCDVMGENCAWSDGLHLSAKGYEGTFYFKD